MCAIVAVAILGFAGTVLACVSPIKRDCPGSCSGPLSPTGQKYDDVTGHGAGSNYIGAPTPGDCQYDGGGGTITHCYQTAYSLGAAGCTLNNGTGGGGTAP
jgi:hypothetical protein